MTSSIFRVFQKKVSKSIQNCLIQKPDELERVYLLKKYLENFNRNFIQIQWNELFSVDRSHSDNKIQSIFKSVFAMCHYFLFVDLIDLTKVN
jgi:SpoVK/Ycf46/Vps4 family AAA+-type ATPase